MCLLGGVNYPPQFVKGAKFESKSRDREIDSPQFYEGTETLEGTEDASVFALTVVV